MAAAAAPPEFGAPDGDDLYARFPEQGVRIGIAVVGDDDGVVVVPADIAAEATDRARRIQEVDRPSRRDGYTKLGLPFDETVA